MQVIDSHTEGEPTRVIVDGGPDLGSGPLAERVHRFRDSYDDIRTTAILEPRGNDAMVGALLCEPVDDSCAAGVIYFNNAGYLNMCGHGTIGVAVTLGYLGRIASGRHRLETPVGIVEIELHNANTVTIENVPSYRYREAVEVDVEGLGSVTGDIAWGGNWFFQMNNPPVPLTFDNIRELTDACRRVRVALEANGITGADGGLIDHLEFFGPPVADDAHSRNFVYCPGGAYDRSPCGTGTSAKLACLAAAGKLQPGEEWVQESIIGSRFTASYREAGEGRVIPRITGRAFICGETRLVRQAGDPFGAGIIGADSVIGG